MFRKIPETDYKGMIRKHNALKHWVIHSSGVQIDDS